MTANGFLSVSLRPPLVLVSLGRCRMNEMLPRSGRYGVSVLSHEQQHFAAHFAAQKPSPVEPTFTWQGGLPAARRRARPPRLPRRRRPSGRRSRALDRRGRVPRPPRRRAAAVLHRPLRHDQRNPRPQLVASTPATSRARPTPGTARRAARPSPPRGSAGARCASGRARTRAAPTSRSCANSISAVSGRGLETRSSSVAIPSAAARGRGRADRVEVLLVGQRRVLAARS